MNFMDLVLKKGISINIEKEEMRPNIAFRFSKGDLRGFHSISQDELEAFEGDIEADICEKVFQWMKIHEHPKTEIVQYRKNSTLLK